MKYILYRFIFPNGKFYIGQTKQSLRQRLNYHKYATHNKRSNNYDNYLYRALRKYGWDNVQKEIILVCDESSIDMYERRFIEHLKTDTRNNGYNLELGGNRNKHLSEETKLKLRNNKLGTKQSIETKEKISKSLIGNTRTLGHKLSAEHKAKLSKSVNCYSKDGKFIKSYISSKDAARLNNFASSSAISECARGVNRRKSYKGFIWRYHVN